MITVPFGIPYPLRYALDAMCAPRYVERGGTQDIANPFRLRDVALDAFLFEADYGRLLALTERDLNGVLRRGDCRRPFGYLLPSARIVPIAPIAMLVCANTARIEVPRVGWIPEVDVAFWIPVLVLAKVGPIRIPVEVAFYQPYLFVDSGQAMATGRETYGYHKMIGDFDLPTDPAHPTELEVRAIAWKTYGPNEKAEQRRVFTLRETSSAPPSPSTFVGFEDAARAVIEAITGGGTSLPVNAINRVIDLLELLDLAKVQQVFLKQFRAIEDPHRACYQAVAKAGSALRHLHRGGVLNGTYELDLEDLVSLDIRQELGLGAGVLTAFAAFWGVIDFDLERGETLGRT